MNTWPVAVRRCGDYALVGIPERLGDGQPYDGEHYQRFPSLEAVAGEHWLEAVLTLLLPSDRTWGWWTRSEVAGKTRLTASRAPRVVNLDSLDRVCMRRWRLRGGALVLIPPHQVREQGQVLAWAGLDTEWVPDVIWTAPATGGCWDLDNMRRWCASRTAWADSGHGIDQPVERTVVLFDGDVFCRLPQESVDDLLKAMSKLAEDWSLRVIPGPEPYAWPAPQAQ